MRSMEAEFSPPEDVLADILGRLPPRDLAQSRRVCSSWRTVVDTRRLLLRHALPHSVRGLFLNYRDHSGHHFFARPSSMGPRIDGKLACLPDRRWDYTVHEHRNGLILVYSDRSESWYVVNPATRRWACLPQVEWRWRFEFDPYLVFEPTVSPHFEVYLVPSERCLRAWKDHFAEPAEELMEQWPRSPCVLQVFSSKTGRWETRAFVREGEAAGTVAELKEEGDCSLYQLRQSAYWKGTLYVHCRGCYVMRLSLADSKYRIIKTPTNIDDHCQTQCCLGNSINGVYFAAIFYERDDLKVWILEESFGKAKWVLKHGITLESTALNALSNYCNENDERWSYVFDGAWSLEDGNDDENCYKGSLEVDSKDHHELPDDDFTAEDDTDKVQAVGLFDGEGKRNEIRQDDQSLKKEKNGSIYDNSSDKEDSNSELLGGNIDWNSDEDDVLSIVDEDETYSSIGYYLILGFHPYKEVVFLAQFSRKGVAYHFNSSKVQYLGTVRADCTESIEKSFVYTPCMIGELPESSSNVQLND